jgi:UDP-glucose 4-epimerase
MAASKSTQHRILITGGAGFVGSSMAVEAIQRGHEVCVYGDLSAGRVTNLAPIDQTVRVEQGNILDQGTLTNVMREFSANSVVHLAALHYIPFCNEHPVETIRVNVDGTACVLEAARRAGVKKVVVASSGAIYSSLEEPLDEKLHAPEPSDIYGLTKLMCEDLCRLYSDKFSLPCVVMRLFNVYGHNESNPHLIPHILSEVSRRDYVELGNVDSKRDYIHVEDAASAFVSIAVSSVTTGVFNVGTGSEHSARELVGIIGGLLGRDLKIRQNAARLRANDKMHQIARIDRLHDACGWTPRLDIRRGLEVLLRHEGLISGLHHLPFLVGSPVLADA